MVFDLVTLFLLGKLLIVFLLDARLLFSDLGINVNASIGDVVFMNCLTFVVYRERFDGKAD